MGSVDVNFIFLYDMNNRVIDRKQQRARAIKYEKVGPPDFDRTNNPFC